MRSARLFFALLMAWALMSAGCINRATPADAWAEYRAQRYDKAIQTWQKVLDRDPLSGEGYYGLGLAQLRQRDYAAAERSLTRASAAIKQRPQLIDCYIQLSNLYLTRHADKRVYIDAAGRMADEVLRADPGNLDALVIWGEVGKSNAREAFNRNELKAGQEWAAKSMESLKQVAAKRPDDRKIQRSLALSQELAGDLRGAAESWQRALAGDGNDAECYRRMLRIYSRINDDAACARLVDQTVQHKPVNAEVVLAVAEEAIDLNRVDLFDRAAASFRSDGDQFSRREADVARLLRRRGLTEEALAHYRLAERGDPAHWQQHRLSVVRILMESGRIAEANAAMEDCRKQAPDDPNVALLSASLLRSEGKLAEAMEAVQKIVSANPAGSEALVEQARIYRLQGNYPMAIAILRACQRTSPDYVPASLELAEVYLQSGMKEAAEIAASSALTKDPVNAEAQRLLSAARKVGR